MSRFDLLVVGLLVLAFSSKGVFGGTRQKRNVGDFPSFSDSLETLQIQSQSQTQNGQSQSQSQSQSSVVCDPPCKHGTCSFRNECTCEDGWSGTACDEFECVDTCVHGRCVAPNTCDCNEGWEGGSCKDAVCESACLNGGMCIEPNKCSCKTGYEGSTCGTPVCEQSCQNGGTCIAPNQCSCPSRFEGTLCQIALPSECQFPFEYNGNIYSACTTVDSTDDIAWCSTTTAYEGDRVTCDYSTSCSAPGDVIEIPGNCMQYYTCGENKEITLTQCESGTVFNVLVGACDKPGNTPQCGYTCAPACENDGVCVEDNVCNCASGFTGKRCEIAEEETASGFSSGFSSGQVPEIGDSLEEGSALTPENGKENYVCSTWGQENFYTFDGIQYTSPGRCGYQLVGDCERKSFDISLTFNETTKASVLTMTMISSSSELVLSNGKATWNGQDVPIPTIQNGIKIVRIPNTEYIIITGTVQHEWISWDGKDTFALSLGKNLRGKVCGLCGNMNGDPSDDLTPKNAELPTSNVATFMNSWSLDDTCSTEQAKDYCGFLTEEQLRQATAACRDAATSVMISDCDVSIGIFEQNCLADLCQCSSGDFKSCLCNAATVYSKLCIANGANVTDWRNENFCAKTCPNNLVYSECGTTCPSTCRNKNQMLLCSEQCVDGCFCPSGTVLDGDKCVPAEECSCTHLGTTFANGATRSEQCEECTCNGGSWTCTELPCPGECSATGDPHYKTFDGLTYSYAGECGYVLATDMCAGKQNYSFMVIAENVECGTEKEGSCTKSAVVSLMHNSGRSVYELKQGGVVRVDGTDVLLPYNHGGVQISYLSSLMIVMKTSMGLEIEWDGAMRLYVKLDQVWKNRVCGLCGNFNSKSTDDMTTPQNIVEKSVAHFGNSWKISEACEDVEDEQVPVLPGACLSSRDRLTRAEEICGILKSDTFSPCHRFVDWDQHFRACREDVCNCGEEEECSCEVLADYARLCTRGGATISWRNASNCAVQCDEGMEYHECAGYCGNTCKSIGNKQEVCSTECQPGCVCQEGLYLTEHSTCVEIQDCGCFHDGKMYAPGASIVLDTSVCTCVNGMMTCEVKQEAETCVKPEVYVDCGSLPKGSTGVACLPTCQDSKLLCESNTTHCLSGCACPEGTIKDELTKKCVKPEQCSCSYDGKIHQSGAIIPMDDCNHCTCNGGVWSCTERACHAECSSIGDPHFRTFDGRTYDFQGDCSYVMAEDFCGDEESGSFRVFIETIPCGDNGVTCTKAVTVYLYNYHIHLTKGDGEPIVSEKIINSTDVPKAPTHVTYNIRKGTIYYIVETNIGIDILWNANNAVKIKLQPNFANSVCGLCGNYDGDMTNDFMMRAGDVAADPNMFGNDWKTADTCPDAGTDPHPCDANPTIAPWAEKRCNIIHSEVFSDCHAEVDPTKFYESCLYDTCGCNAGGDCECFCTAVAAYAQACSEANVCINWRNNDVCPVMCEAYDPGFGSGDKEVCEWKYDTCGNPCPPTCTDPNPTSCPWKQLEGCYVTCKEDEVWDDDAGKCINKEDCPPIPTTTPAPEAPTTTVKTTPKTIPTTTTVPTTTTTEPYCDCVDSNGVAHSPGETWPLRDDESLCLDMTCVEEEPGVCRTESVDKNVLCTEENKPVCQNGLSPAQVQDGCTCKWECQCYCFGQGDPHFFTFDGYYYPFQGNCTFVLSRDMNAHRSNFPHEYEIWMENEACEEAPETTCTRKMTIRYNSTHVVLYKNYTFSINGGSLRHSNTLPTNVNGIHIEMRGISLFYLTIPGIKLALTFTGTDYSWSLSVPYSQYFNITEGLCGVCNNDQSDDLTNRTGVVVSDIEDFGNSWLVYNESRKCFKDDDTCTQAPAKECEIIKSEIFEACHSVIDPEIYYQMCRFDTSRCGNYSYCDALYGYARACDHEGACIPWRSDDLCPVSCPSDRIYEACKPGCDQQCHHYVSNTECEAEEATEGCFCPPETVEVNGECVDSRVCTDCVDDDEKVYEYGQSWVPEGETCSICSCMESQQILCTEKKCPEGTNEVPHCNECFVPEIVRGSDPCCPTYQCVCNYITDAGSDHCGVVAISECDIGYIPVQTNPGECIPEYECQCNTTKSPCPEVPVCSEIEHVSTEEGECCPTHTCKCNKCEIDETKCGECENKMTTVDACGCEHYSCESRNVCRFNGTDKSPGDSWKKTVCETCTCQESKLNEEGCYEPECFLQTCSTTCPSCSEYTPVEGQCCGTCVQVGCVVSHHNNTQCKDIDDVWHNYDQCHEYTCKVQSDGSFGVAVGEVTCSVQELPTCPTCYRVQSSTKDCCPEYKCVPDDVCCMEGSAIKLPGELWAPDSCNTCQCTGKINETSGFHMVQCDSNPCPSFDQAACDETGGHAVPTNDGCCLKCDNKCIDSENNTYMFGETWYPDNCTVCSCAEGHEIVCNPKTCPKDYAPSQQNCAKCEVSRRRADSDPCCPVYDCVCNYDFAKGEPDCDSVPVPTCPAGHVPEQTNVGDCIPKYACVCNMTRNPCPEAPTCDEELEDLITTETSCCPIQTCECKVCKEDTTSCSPCQQTIVSYDPCGCKHVTCESLKKCFADGMLHEVNATWNEDVCTSCQCSSEFDPETSCHYPICHSQSCEITCPACHQYMEIAGQCCGTCVQTGCPVLDNNGDLTCANAGNSWSYTSNCTEYMCVENISGGLEVERVESFTCPQVEVPVCGPCHSIESYLVDCCTNYRCVAQEVCCENHVGKLPGTSWSPNACETCHCSDETNATSGFHVEKCYHVPCPPVDEDACLQNGGMLTATDDGCCMKCQVAECYECDKRISTSPEYMVVEECASVVPISVSYCDGFCRGSYFWSADGADSQCSCCNPTSTVPQSVMMKCKNGTEIEYQYENVLSCGCTATCHPQPPTVTPSPEAPVTTTTSPPKTTTTEEPEESGSGEVTVTIPEAPVTTTTLPPKTIPETTTTTTTEEPEESGSGEVTVTIPEAPVTTTTLPPKTIPETTTTTTTEEPEESGSGEVTVTIPEAPVTTTTLPPKTIPETTTTTTTEEPEESGSGEVTVTIPEAPVTTTTLPPKTIPETTTTTTTEEPEESGSGEVTVTIPEAPVTTTTLPPKTIPETTTTTTTEEPEESGSGEVTVTIPEAPVTTTTLPPKTIPETTTTTTTEEPEESGSGEVTVTIPEAPVTTTTLPPKTIPETTTTTTTEEPEESGSGEVTVTIPEAPVTTTTLPPKTIPETTTTTTTEEPEESGSGEVTVTIPEAPVTTTTLPPKTIPETTTTTTTEEPEESGSGEVTVTIPEAPVTTTTLPPKTIPETTTTTTTEEPEESGSGEVTVTIPEAPVTTTTLPPKTIPETTTTTTTEEPEESGSGEVTVTIPEAPVTTTTLPPKTIPETTTTTTTEEPEESGSGEVTVTIPEAPATTTTTTSKPIPTTTTTEATTTLACYWTDWINSGKPKLPIRDDNETYAHIRENGYDICEKPQDIECRPAGPTQETFSSIQTWQAVSCNVNEGLLCLGSQQTMHPICEDYEIRVYCCPSSNKEDEAQNEIHMVQHQVQGIITDLENGNVPAASNVHNAFESVHDHEVSINQDLESLIHQVNSNAWNQETKEEQIETQNHIQQQIQTLDQNIQQEAQMQHIASNAIKTEVENVLNSANNANGPIPPNQYGEQAFQALSDQISNQAVNSEDINVELQNSIHDLIQQNHNNNDEQVQSMIENMQELQQDHSSLVHQEQAQLNSLNNLDASQELNNAVEQHIEMNQQQQTNWQKNK